MDKFVEFEKEWTSETKLEALSEDEAKNLMKKMKKLWIDSHKVKEEEAPKNEAAVSNKLSAEESAAQFFHLQDLYYKLGYAKGS